MRKLLVILAVLATAAPAAAGGFATVGVSPLPSGEATVWTPTLTVRAHGVTPVDGVRPVITIWRGEKPSELHEFPATPTGGEGTYSARVEFPGPGRWSYTISDGYAGQTHTFAPVEILPAASGTSPTSLPWPAGLGAALLAALALLLLLGRRRSGSAPAAAR